MPRTRSARFPLIVALGFVLALSLIAGATEFRHADDHHYTEAAIQMLETGDWVTPRDGDGNPRLIKPVVTYWLVAASFKVFGISMFSARLPFILGAGLLVWFTGWLGRRLFNDEAGAWSALIMAGNLPWLLAALRTIPDVWLCVFLTMSSAGFLSCVLSGKNSAGAVWTAWLGLGLALATKGLIGLLPLPVALATAACLRTNPGALLRVLPMMTGLGIGVAWYVAMACLYGADALLAFGQDQLNATFSILRVIKQLIAYLVFLPLAFIPWTVALITLKPEDWRAPGVLLPDYRSVVIFTALWTAALILVFSFAYQFSGGRYLLPAFPWLALIMGAVFARAQRDLRLQSGRFWALLMSALVVLLGLLGLCALLGLGAGLLSRGHVALVCVVTGVFVLAAAGLTFDTKGLWKPAGVALVMLGCLPLTYWLVRPGLPHTAKQIATVVKARGPGAEAPVLMDGRGSLAGVVRVLAPERVRTGETLDGLPELRGFEALVISGKRLDDGAYPGCTREVIAYDYQRVDADALLKSLYEGRADAFLRSRQQPYVIIDCRRDTSVY